MDDEAIDVERRLIKDVGYFKLEGFDTVRTIYMDPNEPVRPGSILGFSRGHWEGSTLVITTTDIDGWGYFMLLEFRREIR